MYNEQAHFWCTSKMSEIDKLGVLSLQIPVEHFKPADVEIQARFHHENIAELYGALLWEQTVHLFMEAGEGGSVLEKLDSCGPMREFEIIWVSQQVLRGLEYLHSHKIIHHDIKRKSFGLHHKGLFWNITAVSCQTDFFCDHALNWMFKTHFKRSVKSSLVLFSLQTTDTPLLFPP